MKNKLLLPKENPAAWQQLYLSPKDFSLSLSQGDINAAD